MNKKTYTVRCREPIAIEMARYEGNMIISKRDELIDPKIPIPAYNTWEFKISGSPNARRWLSFGVFMNQAKVRLVDTKTGEIYIEKGEWVDSETGKLYARYSEVSEDKALSFPLKNSFR
jgi:hypothetical protein